MTYATGQTSANAAEMTPSRFLAAATPYLGAEAFTTRKFSPIVSVTGAVKVLESWEEIMESLTPGGEASEQFTPIFKSKR